MSRGYTILRFLLVGMVNTLLGLTIIYIAKWFLGIGDVMANASGYGIGLLASFFLNRSWTFAYDGPGGRAFLAFLTVQGVAYGLNLACVMSLIGYGFDSYVAQALGVLPYTTVSYLGSRYLVFSSVPKIFINQDNR